jgi:hypothetical protein
MQQKENILIGMQKYLKPAILTALSLITISCVSAFGIINISDGWGNNSDSYATFIDKIVFAHASAVRQTFQFDANSGLDVYCIVASTGAQRAATYLIDGEVVPNLNLYAYHHLANGDYIQESGGSSAISNFRYWIAKPSACEDKWSSLTADYTAWNCTPNLETSQAEGSTNNYNISYTVAGFNFSKIVQITILSSTTSNYVKCQSPTASQFNLCLLDSQTNVNHIDDFALYEACEYSTNLNYETNSLCDLHSPDSHELDYLNPNHFDTERGNEFNSGVPNATFQLFEYDLCGTSGVQRTSLGTVQLTSFQNKSRVKDGVRGYNITGYVEGYMPWYGLTYANESYVYGQNTCGIGFVSNSGKRTDSSIINLDTDACGAASCYDNVFNQDENSTDYGGICGSCSNTTKLDDLYWDVAYQSQPKGYYDVHQFNYSVDCPSAQNSVSFLVIVAVLIQILLLFLVGIVVGIIIYLLVVYSGAFFIIKKQIQKKREEKQTKKESLNNKGV